MNKVLF